MVTDATSQKNSPVRDSIVVAIDGPAGTGKSTVARRVAEELAFDFLDTGAMYRAVAAACLASGTSPDDEAAVERVTQSLTFDPRTGHFATDAAALRSVEVTEAASRVARYPAVRAQLVDWQRAFASGRRLVTEGRDQGTDVFPNAVCKFFLTATVEERAKRRVKELSSSGRPVEFETVRAQIQERDERDTQRATSPLRAADDAEIIDTTCQSIDSVICQLVASVRERTEAL